MGDGFVIWFRRLGADARFYIREAVRRQIRKVIEIAITDLDLMSRFDDLLSSVKFEQAHLGNAASFKGRTELLRWILRGVNDTSGLFLEFGVYKGDSINRLAELKPDVIWYGFDSFVGLPEDWTLGAKAGAFGVDGELLAVRENVRLVKGYFKDSLASFTAKHGGTTVAVLHVDCDLYSSTQTILSELKHMLVPGSIIIFDELINYPGWQDGEYKAFMEYVRDQGVSFEYIGYVRTGGQVAVKLTGPSMRLPSSAPAENALSR